MVNQEVDISKKRVQFGMITASWVIFVILGLFTMGLLIPDDRQAELDKNYDEFITAIKLFVDKCYNQNEGVVARHWVNLQGQHQGVIFRCEQVGFIGSSNTTMQMHYTDLFYTQE